MYPHIAPLSYNGIKQSGDFFIIVGIAVAAVAAVADCCEELDGAIFLVFLQCFLFYLLPSCNSIFFLTFLYFI